MKFRRATALLAGSLCVLAAYASRAGAEIVCANGFQNVQGAWIATPYCQDAFVADVARQYGVSVSAKEIRNNPNKKKEVCRLIGQDIRIKESCNEVLPEVPGPF